MNQQDQNNKSNNNNPSGKTLSHFPRKSEEAPPVKESFVDKMGSQLRQLKGKTTESAPKVDVGQAFSFLKTRKKLILIGSGVVLFILLAAIIAPNIPLQLQRSAGFSALESGDYHDAYEKLNIYLADRPNDHQAAYHAAQAAIHVGESEYAARLLNDLYRGNVIADPSLPYYYALVNLNSVDEALEALGAVLAKAPNHVGAHFLRGWLLRDVDGAVRQAREDFLRVDELVGNDDSGFEYVLFLRDYLRKSGDFSVNMDIQPAAQPRPSVLSDSLGFDPGLSGYMLQYRLSSADAFAGMDLPPNAAVALYFSYMLMSQEELTEAESELKANEQQFSDSLAVRQAAAFLRVRRGDYAAAAELFAGMMRDAPDDADTLNNLAITRVLAEWSEDSIADAIKLHGEALEADPQNIVALNNGAYLLITQGDYAAADRLLAEAPADAAPETKLNLGLIGLWRNDTEGAIEFFSSISEQDIPNIGRYVANLYVRQRDFAKAIESYLRYEEANPGDADLTLGRMKVLIESGDWRLAEQGLRALAQQHPDHAGVRHQFAKILLNLNEQEAFAQEKAALLRLTSEDNHYYQALLAEEFLAAGDVEAAVAAAAAAMAGAPDSQSLHAYAATWAQLLVETDTAAVVETLQPLLDTYYNEETIAILGYALADTDAAQAIELIDLLRGRRNLSFVAQRYAGGALAKIGDYRDAIPLLNAARQWLPTNMSLLESLRDAHGEAGDASAAAVVDGVITYLRDIVVGKNAGAATYKIFIPQGRNEIGKKIKDAASDPNSAEASAAVLAAYDEALRTESDLLKQARLLYSRATFLAFLKQFPASAQNFQQALSYGLLNGEEQINALLFYAEVLSQQELYDEVAQVAEQLLDVADSPLHRRIYAASFSDGGDYERAIDEYAAAVLLYPADLDAYYELARLQLVTEKSGEAEQTVKQLLRIAPNYAPAYNLLADMYNERGEREKARKYNSVYSFLTGGGS